MMDRLEWKDRTITYFGNLKLTSADADYTVDGRKYIFSAVNDYPGCYMAFVTENGKKYPIGTRTRLNHCKKLCEDWLKARCK